jgi:hypothetical protein
MPRFKEMADAVQRVGPAHDAPGPGRDGLHRERPEMIVEPGAPGRPDGVSGLQDGAQPG